MARSKLESYLGFAAKSRKLVSGTSTCSYNMQRGKVRLLIIAGDIAENSMKKLTAEAKNLGVTYRVYGDSDTLSHVIGQSGRSAVAVLDDNFAECILKEMDNE